MSQGHELVDSVRQQADRSFSENDARSSSPLVNVLSNGKLFSAVTAAGAGLVGFDGLALNRWRPDATREHEGYFVYLRDLDDGRFWSAGLQPDVLPPDAYGARFKDGLVCLDRLQDGLRSELEIFVSQGRDCELRRLTLRNESDRHRRLDVTSFLEIALNDPEADRSHPAFSKLFVQTAYDPELHAVRAWRRRRSPDEEPAHLVHAAFGGGNPAGFETSRPDFLGRGRTARDPRGLTSPSPLAGIQGSVLDPVAVLRRSAELRPGEEAVVVFVLGAARTESTVHDLVEFFAAHFEDLVPEREAAAAAAWRRFTESNVAPEEADFLRRLSGALLYPDPVFRSERQTGMQHPAPLERLARYGLREDRAFMTTSDGSDDDPASAADARRYHRFVTSLGLSADLLVMDDGSTVLADDALLLRRAAAVVARTFRDKPSDSVHASRRGAQEIARPAPRAPGAATRATEMLQFDNGYGGFSNAGDEYVIRISVDDYGNHVLPPQPWTNVIANEELGFIVSETGAGSTWSQNSRKNRLTPWSNDAVSDPHGESFYIRDEDAGEFWTLTPGPAPAPVPYEVRHGLGYTTFRHTYAGIDHELTQFASKTDPVKVTRIRLRNGTDRDRTISLFGYFELVLGSRSDLTRPFVDVAWNDGLQSITARNPTNNEFRHRTAFVAARGAETCFTVDRTSFLGRFGGVDGPEALSFDRELDGSESPGVDPCAALQLRLTLPANGDVACAFLLGDGADERDVAALLEKLADDGAWSAALDDAASFWRRLTDGLQIETPVPEIDLMVNRWLPYQNLSCRMRGRSAFYQAGGAFGFRDQLQDAAGLVYLDPDLTRRQILLHAANQFVEGDVMHWWHPPTGMGIRTRFSDDLLWLPYLSAFYVRTTGNSAILDEPAPFLTGPEVAPGDEELFLQPQRSADVGDLYDHCCRAIDRSLATGAHGLPLIGTGDWNDGMNRVGREGRGESVWLGFFLYHVLGRFIPLCELRGDQVRIARYGRQRIELRTALNDAGWDGGWYRRAYYDTGEPLGSRENDEARIDALAQAWAVISGAAPPDRAGVALDAMERHLVDEEAGIIRLLTPAFDRTRQDPGYIKGYVPGVRENGGQYTHGVLWAVRALAEADRGDRAAVLLAMLSPVSHAKTRSATDRYGVEPYVVAADVYGEPPHVGRGGWTWYTGSAAWMYRIAVESILGFRIEAGTHLTIEPSIPSSWPAFVLTFRLPDDGTVYDLRVQNPDGRSRGVRRFRVDGRETTVDERRARIALCRDGGRHTVELEM